MENNDLLSSIIPDEPARYSTDSVIKVLDYCRSLNASDVNVQTDKPILALVYGRLVQITNKHLSNTDVGDILNIVYGPNGTAQILSGVDIDTHYDYRPSRIEYHRYRVNGTGCSIAGHDAIQITFRIIPSYPPLLSELQLEQELIDVIAPDQGVVYITGSTGSGKTTLLASIIREIVEKRDANKKVITYEAPIEFIFDDVEMPTSIVSQSEIPRHLPSFAYGVRNAMRRSPNIIMVGEARDLETISAVLEAALTGHAVYTTLHANGVAESIRRLVTSFPSDERLGRTVDMIETIRICIWQKLVPSTDGKRVALKEYLIFDEKVRNKLLSANISDITAATRQLLREYGQMMIDDAKKKYQAGIISEQVWNDLLQRSAKDTASS